ncbi:hypothetical protein QKW52_12710 [Bacillus sonorensis]|nr:hypothetical protein [Bacillus sonorensis]
MERTDGKSPVQRPVEERLAAYFLSGRKGEKEQLKAVLDSRIAKTSFEEQFVRLVLYGESGTAVTSKDALLAYRTAKAIEEADRSAVEQEAMCFWIFHVIQQIRAFGLQLKNAARFGRGDLFHLENRASGALNQSGNGKAFRDFARNAFKIRTYIKRTSVKTG